MNTKTTKIIDALVKSRELLEGELIRYYHIPPENVIEDLHKYDIEDCITSINKALECI